jgi:hypothetical protein
VRLGAGKVPLTKPLDSAGGALFGVVGAVEDTAALVSGEKVDDAGKCEKRELFQEIGVRGEVAIYPKLSGWVKASVSALELEGFKGPAGAAGVTLEGGPLDFRADVLFPKEFSLDASTRTAFTDLSVSEPPDGPVFRYLHLPAPLGAVIYALRDESGMVAVPLNLRLRKEGLTGSDITQVVIETLGTLIGKALLQAPVRVGSGVGGVATGLGGLFGLGGGEEKPLEPAVLEFSPGDASLEESELKKLEPLVARWLESDTSSLSLSHELGEADVPRLKMLANPTRQECLDMIERLRQKTAEEQKKREVLAAQVAAALGTGLDRKAEGLLSSLKDLDRDQGLRERALDQLYEMLRKGAERQAERRTREAGIRLAAERLAQARKVLLQMGAPPSEERLKIDRPRFKVAQAAPEAKGAPAAPDANSAPSAPEAAGAPAAAFAQRGRITVTLGAAKVLP